MSDRPIIRVQHIVKSFGAVLAVNDVSFDVRPGEIFAFLGLAVGVVFVAAGAWRFSKIEA